jgi:hypothetical protein
MNFSTLKGLTIPEGVVTQVADASGNVLWKKAPSEAKITINTTFPSGITDGSSPTAYAYIEIDGVKYGTATEIVVPVGTVISCYGKNSIILNGSTVQAGGTYAYTVQGDIGIRLSVESRTYGPGMVITNGFLYITEL